MARLACAFEAASVGIRVAALAIDKGYAFIMGGGFAGLGPVTLRTRHVLVKPGERVVRTRMVKRFGRLPGVLAVTTRALVA